MDYITHCDLWWIVITGNIGMFQKWVHDAAWDDEFTDGPLDAPIR